MFGAIAGGIASALAGGAMSKLFGGGQKAASGGIQGDVLATDNNTVGMGDAGIKSAIQGSNVSNPDEAVPSFVSGAMAKAGKGLLEGTLQAGTSAVSDKFDFLTSNKVWIATDRSRARRCVEACVYGTLDFVGYPRFPAPVEFIAAVIAYYVHPVNIQTACLIMEGAEFTENIINGVERPVKAAELFAFTLRVRAGNTDVLTDAEENVRQKLRAEGVM